MTLKPFKRTDEKYVRDVCRAFFEQWRPLLKNRKNIAVLLWASDGSQILDYAGDAGDTFEWGRFIGMANSPTISPDDREDISIHERKHDYIADPPVMTYEILRRVVRAIKEEGKKQFPAAEISVCDTFDIGPEFALSDFKYRRHTEITSGSKLDGCGFIDATAHLCGDSRCYAAYPCGIPDGTPFGTFLGKQAEKYLSDMGFDALWLSNGLGFSAEPWSLTGKIFDGKDFHPERLEKTRREVFEFWKYFREACPNVPLLTRGTNNSVGIDYATDGVPLYDIYSADLGICAPPNSPWAAITNDYGLELMGHMTRVCELPEESFSFRFYLHDPWWANSPWYDRYGESPHDIYLPMAISRIDGDGRVHPTEKLNILSIDNSFGDMPDCCVNEVVPHLLKAEKDAPDTPAPLVWVYPMREYTTTRDGAMLSEMYFGDLFVADAINVGMPLCCVVSTDNFITAPLDVFKKSVLIAPASVGGKAKEKLAEFKRAGGNVIYYGSSAAVNRLPSRCRRVNVESGGSALRAALADCGYSIGFKTKGPSGKTVAMALSSFDGAWMLSAHSFDMTIETHLGFPLGAPILTNTDAEIQCGRAVYHFGLCEHKECRVFVSQKDGVVSLREAAPVSVVYHRKLLLTGLSDATVCIFPEKDGDVMVSERNAVRPDETPRYDDRFEKVVDERLGVYYRAEHVDGKKFILLKKGK